jgi:hypothetical protein
VKRLRQRDGTTCGPAVAVVAGALIEPSYGAQLTEGSWFADEQARVHSDANRVWPRSLGTTPAAMARILSKHRPYEWRLFRGRRDDLVDVIITVAAGLPVAMLVGNLIPRHWVLLIQVIGDEFRCYEPSSGEIPPCSFGAVRHARLVGLGFPRPFAFVVPKQLPLLAPTLAGPPAISGLQRLFGSIG